MKVFPSSSDVQPKLSLIQKIVTFVFVCLTRVYGSQRIRRFARWVLTHSLRLRVSFSRIAHAVRISYAMQRCRCIYHAHGIHSIVSDSIFGICHTVHDTKLDGALATTSRATRNQHIYIADGIIRRSVCYAVSHTGPLYVVIVRAAPNLLNVSDGFFISPAL